MKSVSWGLGLCVFILLEMSNVSYAATTRCDDFASSPHDKRAQAPHVSYVKLRSQAQSSVEHCREAISTFPDSARAKYQLGRSLIALGENVEGAHWMRLAAEAGYPAAMNAFGVLLNHGRGVERNNVDALKFFKAAAAEQNVPGMANLGAMYSNVTGASASGVVDRKSSLKWLNAAAQAGDPLAMARLGWNHGMGDGGARKDKRLAYQWVDRAIAKNEESALYIGIEISRTGFQDSTRAGKYKKLARGRKNRLALASLSNHRYTKKSIEQFSEIGFRFDRPEVEPTHIREFVFDHDEYHATLLDAILVNLSTSARRAAEKFIAEVERKRKPTIPETTALFEGADTAPISKTGADTKCDTSATSPHDNRALPPYVSYSDLREHASEAVKYCREAVAEYPDNPRAKYQLARSLIALGKDKEAARWLLIAAKAEYPAAMNAYGVLLNIGRGVAVNYKVSFDWLRRAAEKRSGPAAINVATAYFMGLGTLLDDDAGTYWTKFGAAAGDPKAMFTLAAGLYHGLWYRTVKVRRNIAESARLLVQAHDAGEREATYLLYQVVDQLNFKKSNRVKLSEPLLSRETYEQIAESSLERRLILEKLLKGGTSKSNAIVAIQEIMKLPHPVDRADHEPIYVVDAYMDNEYVLGQLVKGAVGQHIGQDVGLTNAYHALVNSNRSFERTDRQIDQ